MAGRLTPEENLCQFPAFAPISENSVMEWVLARHTDDGTAGVSRLVRGGSGPYGLSSVVPSGFVLPRGFVEGIIREDETCQPSRRPVRTVSS